MSTIWYISTTGSDTTGDGTAGNPFATVSKALTSASNGDTLSVAEGTYNLTRLNINKSVTLKGNNHDKPAAIGDGTLQTRNAETILIFNGDDNTIWPQASSIVIEGFTLQNGQRVIRDNSATEFNNVIIRNNIFNKTGGSNEMIQFFGNGNRNNWQFNNNRCEGSYSNGYILLSNKFNNVTIQNNDFVGSGNRHLFGSPSNMLLKNNYFSENSNTLINMNGLNNPTIENNICRVNSFGLQFTTSNGGLVKNNQIIGVTPGLISGINYFRGIDIFGTTFSGPNSKDLIIENNTFSNFTAGTINNDDQYRGIHIRQGAEGITIRNNTFTNCHSALGIVSATPAPKGIMMRSNTFNSVVLSVKNLSATEYVFLSDLNTQGPSTEGFVTNSFHVSTSGSDTNYGFGTNNAFATVSKALTTASAGETINVGAGTYGSSSITTLTINKSIKINGANKDVSYSSLSRAAETSLLNHKFDILANDVEINGVKVTGPNLAGQTIFGGDNKSFNNLVVKNSIFENVNGMCLYYQGTGVRDVITFDSSKVSGIGNGTDGTGTSSAFNPWLCKNVTINNCLIENVDYNGINLESVQNAVVTNNIIRNIGKSGIQLANNCTGTFVITNNQFTQINCRYYGWGQTNARNSTVNPFAPRTVSGTSNPDWQFFYAGIKWFSSANPLVHLGSYTIENNTFDNCWCGYQFARELPAVGGPVISFNNNTFQNNTHGDVMIYRPNSTNAVYNLKNNVLYDATIKAFDYTQNGNGAGTVEQWTTVSQKGASKTIVVSSTSAALFQVETVPDSPTSVSATGGDGQATISFTPPVNNGGFSITSYTVTSSPGGFTACGSASPLTVTGLTNEITFTFTVVATNLLGNSENSTKASSVYENLTYYNTPILVNASSDLPGVGVFQINVLDINYTSNTGPAYGLNTGYSGVISKITITALDVSSNPITNFTSNPITLTFDLPNANSTATLKFYKLNNGLGTLMDPQPSGYPVTLQYQSGTTWTAVITSLSEFIVLEDNPPSGSAGGDPHICDIYKNKITLPNEWSYVRLYQKDDIQVNGKCEYINDELLKSLHTMHDNKITLINPDICTYVKDYTYFTELDIYKNGDLILKYDMINAKEVINNGILIEKYNPKGLYSLTHKTYYKPMKLSGVLIYLNNNNFLEVSIDTFWDDVNNLNLLLYDKNLNRNKNEYEGEFFGHSKENEINNNKIYKKSVFLHL